ncbi:MAG: PqiC family protein [Acidiphilium sp.]
MRRHLILASLLTLVACSSKPTTYLALAPVAGSIHPDGGTPVAVAHVAMPASIDRLYLTSATGPNTLHVANHARWGAPLGGEAQSALAVDLAQRLPGIEVSMPGDKVPRDARTVRVNVIRFLPEPEGVALDADWSVTACNHPPAKGRARIRVPAGAMPGDKAAAMSTALGRLADRIAARLG